MYSDILLFQICINSSIVYRLRRRPPSQHQHLNERRRRTNNIIIAVTCIFFLSWLPFNIYTITTALKLETFGAIASIKKHKDEVDEPESEFGMVVYGLLHLLGAANACTNPILYGILNENFLIKYKRHYRWLPGYYGDRARRYSIPGFQLHVLNHNLERQNAFRLQRNSIAYPHNSCPTLETAEEESRGDQVMSSRVNISSGGESNIDNISNRICVILGKETKIDSILMNRKIDDVDSAYEDGDYSTCPTTADSLKNQTFDFEDIEKNGLNKSTYALNPMNMKSNLSDLRHKN